MIGPRVFTAVTFNIQHGSDGIYDHPGDPDMVAQAITELDADIIGLQEVDVAGSRAPTGPMIRSMVCGRGRDRETRG